PTAPTSTRFTCVRGSTCSSTCAKFSSTTMAVAPESLSWCSSSGAVYSGLVLTTISPARRAPKSTIGYCRVFGSMTAMRSPFRKPACCSQAAKARVSSSSFPYLSSVPIWTKATRAACRAQACSSSCFSERSCAGSTSAGTSGGYDFSQTLSIDAPASPVLLEQRLQVRPDRVQDRRLARSVWMHAVGLHEGRIEGHLLQQERYERQMILVCQLGEYTREALRVARPVVGRNADADQQHACPGRLRQAHHAREVLAGLAERQSAQPVVGAELQDHRLRPVQLQCPRQPFNPAAGSLAAHAGVD